MSKSEPRCTEVTCSASLGASVQIVEFKYTRKYNFLESRTFEIPEDWTEDQVKEFQSKKTEELKSEVESLSDKELESCLQEKKELGQG